MIVTSGDPSKVIVGEPAPPVLEEEQVTEAGGDRFTYRVTYKQAQNLPPAWVRLEIACRASRRPRAVVDMVREAEQLVLAVGWFTPTPHRIR